MEGEEEVEDVNHVGMVVDPTDWLQDPQSPSQDVTGKQAWRTIVFATFEESSFIPSPVVKKGIASVQRRTKKRDFRVGHARCSS